MESIINTHHEYLNQDQQAFCSKIEEIKQLQEEFERLSIQIPNAILEYTRAIHPITQKITFLEKQRLVDIDAFVTITKFSKKELLLIDDYMCYEVIYWIQKYGEDELLILIFQKYAHMPLDEYIHKLSAERSQSLKKPFNDSKESIEDSNITDIEDLKKKSATERLSEKNKMKQEVQRKKTVRSVYIDLIKIFHPDTETDADKKLEKEEISKKITEAYTKNDLFTLLKLETDYLEKHTSRISSMREDTLQIYLNMLSGQKKDIELSISKLKNENQIIYSEMCRPSSKPEKFLRKVKKELKEIEHILTMQTTILQQQDCSIKSHLLNDMENTLSRKDYDSLLEGMIF